MTEEERVKSINEKAVQYMEELMAEVDESNMDPDDFAAKTYAMIVVAYLLGYSPDAMIPDARNAADRLLDMADAEIVSEKEVD